MVRQRLGFALRPVRQKKAWQVAEVLQVRLQKTSTVFQAWEAGAYMLRVSHGQRLRMASAGALLPPLHAASMATS